MLIYDNKINTQNYPVNFKGHAGCDIIKECGRKRRLTTETAFFRDFDTLKFAVNYINDVFQNVKTKRFLVGGCSSGEEVWSLKMLMGDHPVKITGFDLSPTQIENAQKGSYEICIPSGKKGKKLIDTLGVSAYKDYYLAADEKELTGTRKILKQMFDKMFEGAEKKGRIIYCLKERFRQIFNLDFLEFEKEPFILRNPAQQDCKFIVGDIMDLDKINGGEKNQLFSFRNAIYHITTNNDGAIRTPYEPEVAMPKLNTIFKKVNNSLQKNGLFIMGEKEHEQGGDLEIVFESLMKNGFLPFRTKAQQPYYNIWFKNKDV